MVTIKDIAHQAQVSPATVSRVLKGDSRLAVSQETRERIQNLAQELGYTKHLKKQLPQEKKGTIGIVQWYTENEELADLYYYSIRVSIEQAASQLGYQLVRAFNDLNHPLLDQTDGIIAIGKFSAKQIQQLAHIQDKLVFVDCDTLEAGFSCITTDFEHSVKKVIDHFRSKQIEDIGLMVGEEVTTDGLEKLLDPRLTAYKNYMTQLDLYEPQRVFIGNFSTQSGYQLMCQAIEELGEKLPAAFFMANDTLAVGALRALQEKGIAVPDRVQLITFNDTAITRQVYPALSSISVYTEEMGEEALFLLDKMLTTSSHCHPRKIKLGTQLTIRDSSL
ncbi:LacI family DNA-binding transcriptional regulator [Streptococcus oriscaviae]|uniref:LacI family DNA-binding transcriptional regulator n=1 Tax=Streptococcus oriscaviae TaxID=2781599 RepID=A0ABX7YK63_9STRE|nr:LacI family DNA-binding transcriptional regulator [Streptococcus oriscaviae]QUE53867.1 LacI family DNA-binding transcriptional regulator [Streptococcus oriscaviae]